MLRQRNLHDALARVGSLGEDIENQRRAVNHFDRQSLL